MNSLQESPCFAFRNRGGAKWVKHEVPQPIETILYDKARKEHPQTFAKLEAMFKSGNGNGPRKCQEAGVRCVTLVYGDGSGRCIDEEARLPDDVDGFVVAYVDG